MKKQSNIAFIDGQNLHLGITGDNWDIDHKKFRIYLKDKYHISEAYYFFGFVDEEQQNLYKNLQKAGFIVCFKEHHSALKTTKKGNVDTDIVFEAMKIIIERNDFGKIYLISGDGDYKKLVDYLIKKDKFGKILFPSKQFASSLYKQITRQYFDYLDRKDIRNKIEYIKKRGP